jgi:hypothetical protein
VATEKKTPSRKTTSARKKSTPTKKSSGAGSRTTRKASAPRAEARPQPAAGRVAEMAAEQLLDLTGREPEGVTGLERTEDGWKVLVDVAELRRVPNTTDILATYEVEVDSSGNLRGYRRVHRFVRGAAGEE